MRKRSKFLRKRKKDSGFIIKTNEEIELMAAANQIVAQAFEQLRQAIEPGVSLKELDTLTEEFIRSQGALPLYKNYRGNPPVHPPFPGVICASVNDEICHGFPDHRKLKKGDIVGIDIGLRYKDFCGDSCVTFAVGEVSEEIQTFMDVAKECLYVGIDHAQPGRRLGELGQAIQDHAEKHGYNVVREYGGHGIGRNLHEPLSVPHHGPANYGPRLKPGMVFTVEPMINMGKPETRLMSDGWTVKTVDGRLSAQYEHTIAITPNGPRILSQLPELAGS